MIPMDNLSWSMEINSVVSRFITGLKVVSVLWVVFAQQDSAEVGKCV